MRGALALLPPRPPGYATQYAFCDVAKLRNAGLPVVRRQTDYNVFSRIKGNVEKGLWHLFMNSRSSYFFNKTNFELYLLSSI